MGNLGRMLKVTDLRDIWPNEQRDLSKWLAKPENLKTLSDAIGIGDIVLEERESRIGDYFADLYAKEDGTGRKIIIENQLESTNHDHLGKIITYAAGKNAEIVIWIVKKARDEHKQAIEWLNQYTDENLGFFLLEIELWKIDNSLPAPKFNIVEAPNDWAKSLQTMDDLSEVKALQLNFWQHFKEYASDQRPFMQEFTLRKPRAQHWYSFSLGTTAFRLVLTVNTKDKVLGTEIYIPHDKELFQEFCKKKEQIEAILENKVECIEANKDCRILTKYKLDIKNKQDWDKAYAWFCNMALKFKEVSNMFI